MKDFFTNYKNTVIAIASLTLVFLGFLFGGEFFTDSVESESATSSTLEETPVQEQKTTDSLEIEVVEKNPQ